MKNASVTFTEDDGPNSGWTSHVTGMEDPVNLCDEEFSEYVDLPEGTSEFEAVFTVREPAGNDHFALVGYSPRTHGATLKSRVPMGLMNGAKNLIAEMHEKGYRYLKVVY